MLSKYKLVSSNKRKLEEYKSFGLDFDIASGNDLPEVDSNSFDVIAYKAEMNGIHTISEDTSLHIENSNVGVNIKWMINHLSEFVGKKALWEVVLGKNDGKFIYVYQGLINGIIVEPRGKGYAFDPFFQPENCNFTLAELDEQNLKHKFSARKNVAENLLNDNYLKKFSLPLEVWQGKWQ